jgi:hypothetical protein
MQPNGKFVVNPYGERDMLREIPRFPAMFPTPEKTYTCRKSLPDGNLMAIGFHPALFDAERFQSLAKGDIRRRVKFSIRPGKFFSREIDGYDIASFRFEEEPYRPVGSIVDYLFDHLPEEAPNHPGLPKTILLLGKLTERYGNLADGTDAIYLGYLNAGEVILLRTQLAACPYDTFRTMEEKNAMVKILSVAERNGTGLIFSQT